MEIINIKNTRFKIYTHGNNDFISRALNKYKCWEPFMTNIIYYIMVNTPGYFIDIGANIGYYSLFIASLNKKVYAFEPSKINYKLFEKSIKYNKLSKNIKLFKFALGDTSKKVYLHENSSNYGATKITNRKTDLETEIKKFDNVNIFKNKKIALVKIDVEGYEYEVINGMINSLSNISNLIIEFSPKIRHSEFYLTITNLLLKNNYNCYDLGGNMRGTYTEKIILPKKIGITFIKNFLKTSKQTNILFSKTI